MQCPVCKDVSLVMTDRQNVEIDYCPQCRGVWLDRGELDKIIERSQQLEARFLPQSVGAARQDPPLPEPGYAPSPSAHPGNKHGCSDPQPSQGGGWRDSYQSGHQSQHGHQSHGKHQGQQPYRKKSFLQELFD